MPDFLKNNIDLQKNFIRGAARLIIAPLTQAYPTVINDVVRTAVTATSEVQTITITGAPTGGTFTLSFKGYTTTPIAFNATAAVVDTALEALASIGTGGVTVTGGPGPATPYVVTFAGQLAGQSLPLITANSAGFTGGTTPTTAVTRTTPGFGQYDSQTGWTNIGSTKGGIRVLRNNSEEVFDVDQIQAEIMSQPTAWEMNVATSVAEIDLDIMQYLWEGGTITVDGATGERTLPLGTPVAYRQRRLVVGYQRASTDGGVTPGGIQLYCFRITQRSPQESVVTFNKTGDQTTLAFQWRCLADPNVPDMLARFGGVIDQK